MNITFVLNVYMHVCVFIYLYIHNKCTQYTLGVWRDTYPTRRDWVHENEMRFLDFKKKKNPQWWKIVFYSTEKHKMQKM